MTDIGLLKLKKEFEELEDNSMTDIGCQVVWLKNEDDYYVWEGMMQGPKIHRIKGHFFTLQLNFKKISHNQLLIFFFLIKICII